MIAHVIRPFLQAADAENPSLRIVNTKKTCFELLQRTLQLAGPDWAFIGKTAGELGKYIPPDFVPVMIGVTRPDGQIQKVLVAGVSMDAAWYLPSQRQVKVIVNSTDGEVAEGGAGKPARLDSYDIDPEHYRWNNPPVVQTLLGSVPNVPSTPIPEPEKSSLDFPPRNFVGYFFKELNTLYARARRANRAKEGTDPLYINDEGIFVWVSEYLRRYAIGDHKPSSSRIEDRHIAAMEAVLADVKTGLGLP